MKRGRPVVIVAALLLLLTYLLIESRSPDQLPRRRAQQALQALQLQDAALNRAILMTRAGLLLHYDSLPDIARDLENELHTIERESRALAASGDRRISVEAQTLADALRRKDRLIEHFTSDNAVLRNSTTYFAHLVDRLGRSGGREPLVADALPGSLVLMRLMQAPQSTARAETEAAVAALARVGAASRAWAPLAAHARIIVDLLPQVDGELRGIITADVGGHAEALQRALLQSAGAAEARAQRFRLMLYASAIVLLTYLLFLFARLRAKAIELRRKEMQLIQANKMTALGTLVSSVAHEINNPNQIVLTNAGVLASAWDDVVQALDESCNRNGGLKLAGLPYAEMRQVLPRLVREAEDGARRIEQIVGDLKNFARPGTRVSEFYHLNDIVRRTLRLLTHLIQKRTDAFRVELADTLPLLRGNPRQVEQVAVNLVVNALESLPDRTASVTITTAHDEDARQVVLAVRDDGIGIPRDQLARLGEAFFTTKEASGGTGLGIAIASSLVRLHDGQLGFSSQPGKGTCATVRLPLPAGVDPAGRPSAS